jgi:hypothetical protein
VKLNRARRIEVQVSIPPLVADLHSFFERQATPKDELDCPGQDVGHERLGVRNELHLDHVHFRPAEHVLVVGLQYQVAAASELSDLVRPGPDELLAPVGELSEARSLLEEGALEDVPRQRERQRSAEHGVGSNHWLSPRHGPGVRRLYTGNRVQGAVAELWLFSRHSQREQEVGGREGSAVVPSGALADSPGRFHSTIGQAPEAVLDRGRRLRELRSLNPLLVRFR